MKKPLQDSILDLLAAGPMTFDVICDKLAPRFKNRASISASLQTMRQASKLRSTRLWAEGQPGSSAIWEIAPVMSNELSRAWPVPFTPLPGTVRKHRLEL
jgi:hypothetical protein